MALLWGSSIVVSGLGPLDVAALVGDATMKTEGVELWRELLGLVIIAAYCLAAAAMQRASLSAAPTADPDLQPR